MESDACDILILLTLILKEEQMWYCYCTLHNIN